MGDVLLQLITRVGAAAGSGRERLAGERGEGVISAAIAVLVMAFLGVVMWGIFNGILTDAGTSISDQVGNIGE